jgi:hypothetical protein
MSLYDENSHLFADWYSISLLVVSYSFFHFSRTLLPYLIFFIASSGFGYLKIVWILIYSLTFSQISLEILARISSNLFSFWLICLEMVHISLSPVNKDGKVSSIYTRSPLLIFLNYLSKVERNLTKSLAYA